MANKIACTMDVQVTSDFVCPWCIIGKRRLEQTLKEFVSAHPEVAVTNISWKPYRLLPVDMAPMKKTEFYVKKFGAGSGMEQARARVKGEGVKVGIDFNYTDDAWIGPTTDAHRLVAWSPQDKKDALVENLFVAHHIKGQLISAPETLTECAVKAGLDAKETSAFLQSDELRGEITQQIESTKQDMAMMGGVPYFHFTFHGTDPNGGTSVTAVSGAQDSSYFKLHLDRALSKAIGSSL